MRHVSLFCWRTDKHPVGHPMCFGRDNAAKRQTGSGQWKPLVLCCEWVWLEQRTDELGIKIIMFTYKEQPHQIVSCALHQKSVGLRHEPVVWVTVVDSRWKWQWTQVSTDQKAGWGVIMELNVIEWHFTSVQSDWDRLQDWVLELRLAGPSWIFSQTMEIVFGTSWTLHI